MDIRLGSGEELVVEPFEASSVGKALNEGQTAAMDELGGSVGNTTMVEDVDRVGELVVRLNLCSEEREKEL